MKKAVLSSITFIIMFLAMGFDAGAQNVGYGAGRPKKGPNLPPVEYAKKDTAKVPVHGQLVITVDYVLETDNSVSGMKVAEVSGDTQDKAYVNECILKVFDQLKKDHASKTGIASKERKKMRLPVKIPAVY